MSGHDSRGEPMSHGGNGHMAQGSGPQGTHPRGRGRSRLVLLVMVGLAIFLAAWGILGRAAHTRALAQETHEAALPRVTLVHPKAGPATRTLDLPANLAAWYQAPIYAQVSGYVKMWYKDFGARVKQGDVLAEINTPGLDAQYAAAKATLNVQLARYHLAVLTANRWAALRGTQAVSRQEVDVQAANAAAEKAQVEAAQHEVDRYEALENFKRIVAPFDGIVTSRLVNVGDYVNPGGGNLNSSGRAAELFSVADVHRMRVFVSVPQDFAAVISPKVSADLSLPQYPGRKFKASFLATARAFNADTRTVTTELTLPNDDGLLWPDSYATAHFEAPGDPSVLILPVSALIFRAEGTQVAEVVNGHVHLVHITVGINFGTTFQVMGSLKTTDNVIMTPTADILEGQQVKVVEPTNGYNTQPAPQDTSDEKHDPNDDTRAMPEGNNTIPGHKVNQ